MKKHRAILLVASIAALAPSACRRQPEPTPTVEIEAAEIDAVPVPSASARVEDADEWSDVLPVRAPYPEAPEGRALAVSAITDVRDAEGDAIRANVGGVPTILVLATRESPQGWRSAVSAFRLSRLLDLDAVPITIARALTLQELLDAADDTSRMRLREIVSVRADGRVPAAIALETVGTTTREAVFSNERARWEKLASSDADLTAEDRESADGYVSMLVLDYLSGNLFRRTVEEDLHGKLWLVSDRGMFAEHPAALGVDQNFEKLKRATTFPSGLREALSKLDEESLVRALEAGAYEDWLVHRRPVREILLRARAVRSLVDAGGMKIR